MGTSAASVDAKDSVAVANFKQVMSESVQSSDDSDRPSSPPQRPPRRLSNRARTPPADGSLRRLTPSRTGGMQGKTMAVVRAEQLLSVSRARRSLQRETNAMQRLPSPRPATPRRQSMTTSDKTYRQTSEHD